MCILSAGGGPPKKKKKPPFFPQIIFCNPSLQNKEKAMCPFALYYFL